MSPLLRPALLICLGSALACGSSDSTECADSGLAGCYAGTFSGDDSGTWDIEVGGDCGISGTGFSNSDGVFSLEGSIAITGSFVAGVTGLDSTFRGLFNGGSVTGTWENDTFGESGTLSGSAAPCN